MNSRQQAYYDQIRMNVELKVGCVISDRYEKMVSKMVFQCQNGHQWDTEARSILKGMWCRYCHGNTREQGEINFRQRVSQRSGIVLGKYSGNHNKVLIQCELGHQWEVIPYNLAKGKWCPTCGYKHHGGRSDRFMQTLQERKGILLDPYINSRTRVHIQCNNGHIWNPKPRYIVIGNWCPFCTGSSGENAIATYLSEIGIPYEPQGKFLDSSVNGMILSYNTKDKTLLSNTMGKCISDIFRIIMLPKNFLNIDNRLIELRHSMQ